MPQSRKHRFPLSLAVVCLAIACLCLICSTPFPHKVREDVSSAALRRERRVLGSESDAPQRSHGRHRDTQTNANGDYSFPAIPVGTYTLTFDMTGFKTNIAKGLLSRSTKS